ncbi:MAG: dTMP kinase [Actinobacteria bacterium]|nr:dTMP kinase [Actinomycetota bacterium]
MPTGPRYIALEGAEGCGKSTQAALLATALDAVLTRETGGTDIGRRIREILHDTETHGLAHRAEALLTAADRAQHIEQVVAPALAAGRHVVSDRSVHSTLAYQGYGRELPIDELRHINGWAIGGCWPHLAIFLDVDPAVLEHRMHGRQLDRFEQEDAAFHDRVRAGFRQMADDDPQHWVVIDGSSDPDRVAVLVRQAVRDRLQL